ncbi:hypothetical protein PG999_012155 [Apiospora kogelbergensis]|uniref:Uncharacterized protein n=2 Tax=Apiospora kogelbergensis TaxID=1337665 RepID=A0AAW0QQT3_9PEZI
MSTAPAPAPTTNWTDTSENSSPGDSAEAKPGFRSRIKNGAVRAVRGLRGGTQPTPSGTTRPFTPQQQGGQLSPPESSSGVRNSLRRLWGGMKGSSRKDSRAGKQQTGLPTPPETNAPKPPPKAALLPGFTVSPTRPEGGGSATQVLPGTQGTPSDESSPPQPDKGPPGDKGPGRIIFPPSTGQPTAGPSSGSTDIFTRPPNPSSAPTSAPAPATQTTPTSLEQLCAEIGQLGKAQPDAPETDAARLARLTQVQAVLQAMALEVGVQANDCKAALDAFQRSVWGLDIDDRSDDDDFDINSEAYQNYLKNRREGILFGGLGGVTDEDDDDDDDDDDVEMLGVMVVVD